VNILFDIVHPAHVHFFKHMIRGLQASGHRTLVVARKKDVTIDLLELYGIEHEITGESRPRSRIAQLAELLERDRVLYSLGRKFGAELVLTRNPAGVQAARLLGVTGVFDTDDGTAAGIHFRVAAPFAHVITTPDCFTEDYGRKHLKYPGYKQSAYLHPDLFTPNAGVLEPLGVKEGEKFFLVRFVSMHASHDKGESGLGFDAKRAIIERLQAHGRVFITSEGELPEQWRHLQVRIPPHLIHDVLAFASLFVGDSQTMAAEAAVLGTPSLRASTFVGRISYLEELEHRYGLTFAFHPTQAGRLLEKLDLFLAAADLRGSLRSSHGRLLADKENIAQWFIDRIANGTFARPASAVK
jgi:predicted glycosyltransferase